MLFIWCYYFDLLAVKFTLLIVSETALQLEALVGDLEDAALFVMACLTGSKFSSKPSISSISEVRHFHFIQLLNNVCWNIKVTTDHGLCSANV